MPYSSLIEKALHWAPSCLRIDHTSVADSSTSQPDSLPSSSQTMPKKVLRILVTPLNGHGHLNAAQGLVEELRNRGHEVIFVLDKAFAGRMARYGFKEHILETEDGADEVEKDFWPEFIRKNATRYEAPPLEQLGGVIADALGLMADYQNRFTDQYEAAIGELAPDLIVHDGYLAFPCIVNSPIPWLWLYSASPLGMLLDPRLPPFWSGLPVDGDKTEWADFTAKALEALSPLQKRVNADVLAHGGKDLEGRLHPFSPFLNVFMQPLEMRYPQLDDLPETIIAVDSLVRTLSEEVWPIPAQLADKPGKLVFFSMGSFGCANRAMMTRLVGYLAASPHRFIISKGPLQYDLPGENLWGEPFLPQTAILPLVDLVVTHGGNNTITETFFYGKPTLVMGLFGDQFDNAQRIAELGLGARLDPYRCTQEQLLTTIDTLLANEQLRQRMEAIGERMRASDDKLIVADLIETKLGAK